MANSPFIDLKDEVALRRFLSDLHSSVTTTQILLQQTGLASDNLKLMSSVEIKKKIQDSVKEFDKSMWNTINEVTTNLQLLIPSETDIVKTISDEIAVTSSDLTASVKSTAVTAIAENGTWATAQSVNDVSSNLATNYSTSSQTAATYATQTAVGAIYEVNVEANGHVSGYRAVATGSTPSIFQIYAEKFAISSSSTQEGYSPFQVDTANHKINMTSNVAIDGSLLISGSITAPAIAANTITTNEIASNTITASNIASNTITADRMNVSTLSSISANIGNITAGSISGNIIASQSITADKIDTTNLVVQNVSSGGASPSFEIKANGTAGPNNNANIYGAYIKGSTVEVSSLITLTDAGALTSIQKVLSCVGSVTGVTVTYTLLVYAYNSTSTNTYKLLRSSNNNPIAVSGKIGIYGPGNSKIMTYLAVANTAAQTVTVNVYLGTTLKDTASIPYPGDDNYTEFSVYGVLFVYRGLIYPSHGGIIGLQNNSIELPNYFSGEGSIKIEIVFGASASAISPYALMLAHSNV